MLKITGLRKSFGSNVVLDGIDLEINKGDVIALLGPSGSGKTTLLRCISFLENPDAGSLELGDMKIDMSCATAKDIHALRMNMGFVFQSFNLFNNMTALENVMEPLVSARKVPKKEAREMAMEVLRKVGLEDRASFYPDALSGGQQQRVSIARAIVYSPEIVLFDEPTSALDPELTREVLEVMANLAKEGITMLVVTHHMEFARRVANSVVFMEGGHMVENGTPEEIFSRPRNERTREFLATEGYAINE